jgi:hemerythrin-like domain-containing protein
MNTPTPAAAGSRAIEAWHAEHGLFQRLLALLQGQIDRFALGEEVDYTLMLQIIDYLREFSDRFHHPREDEAFARLARKRADLRVALARLAQEHRVIARAGETLRELLREVASADALLPRTQIELAAAHYLVYYGNHIAREEEDILPAAAAALDASDWQAVKAAAPSQGGEDPLFGPRPDPHYDLLRQALAAG